MFNLFFFSFLFFDRKKKKHKDRKRKIEEVEEKPDVIGMCIYLVLNILSICFYKNRCLLIGHLISYSAVKCRILKNCFLPAKDV